jgi:hypothetical protein
MELKLTFTQAVVPTVVDEFTWALVNPVGCAPPGDELAVQVVVAVNEGEATSER